MQLTRCHHLALAHARPILYLDQHRLASEAADIIDELGLKGVFAFKADISAPLTEMNTSIALSPAKGNSTFDVAQLCAPQALEVMLNVLYFPTAGELCCVY